MKIKQNPSAIYTKLEDKVIILEAERGELLTLNQTASFIWEKSKKAIEVEKLIDMVCQGFKVEKKVAAKDTKELVQSLLKRGLLLRVKP